MKLTARFPSWLMDRRFVWFGIGLSTLFLSFAALSLRPLYWDGAIWIYDSLTFNTAAYDPNYLRFLDTVLIWPAIGVQNLFLESDVTALCVRIICFCYLFHPLLSLWVCHRILRHYQREELILFPILSFATAVLPGLTYAVGMANDAISVFWPLFFLILFRKPGSRITFAWVLFLSLALAFSYESAFIFFLFLAGLVAHQIRSLRAQSQSAESRILLTVLLLGALWLIYRILGPTAGSKYYFYRSLGNPITPNRVFSIVAVIVATIPLWIRQIRFRGRDVPVQEFSLAIFAATLLWDSLHEIFPGPFNTQFIASHDARTSAIPLALIVAFGAYRAVRSEVRGFQVLTFITGCALILAAMHDLSLTLHWRQGITRVRETVETSHGCQLLTPREFEASFNNTGIYAEHLPKIAVLLQGRKAVNSLPLVTNDNFKLPPYCGRGPNQNRSAFRPEISPRLNDKYFDFSGLRDGVEASSSL